MGPSLSLTEPAGCCGNIVDIQLSVLHVLYIPTPAHPRACLQNMLLGYRSLSPHTTRLPQERLQLEAPPTIVLEPNMEASLKELLDSIAGRVQSIGDNIKGAWDAAGAAVGNGIMRVGYAISQLL